MLVLNAPNMFSSSGGVDVFTRRSSDDDHTPTPVPHTTLVLHIFFAFQLFSLTGLSIILFTAAIKRTWKHPTWINFCVTWIISCISYSLLVGRPLSYVPPHQICLAQAALIYTVPTLTASATFCLVLHVFMMVRRCGDDGGKIVTIALVVVPYLAASGMMALSLVVALRDPGTVRRTSSGLYCNMGNDVPGKISAGVVTIIMIFSLILEAIISMDVKRQWSLLRAPASSTSRNSSARSRSATSSNGNSRNRGYPTNSAGSNHPQRTQGSGASNESDDREDRTSLIALAVKILVFSVFSIFAVGLGIIFTFAPHQAPALNIVLALIPTAAVCVFGAQRDLVDAWSSGLGRIRDLVIRPIANCSLRPKRRTRWRRQCHTSQVSTDSQEKMVPEPSNGHIQQWDSPISPLEDC